MNVPRREFLQLAAGSVLTCGVGVASATRKSAATLKAAAFDAFVIFDPRPIAARVEAFFPGNASAIMNTWRARQFEYQWLRALSGQYANFLQTTEEALAFTCHQLKLDLSPDQRRQLMAEWSNLSVWPEVPKAISALHEAGLRLTVLSNMTSSALVKGLENARLDDLFESVLSTDELRSYKPDPRAYRLATDRLRLQRDEILFVPSAGWDVAGAKWFGYPTFWVNRSEAPAEELGVGADATGEDLGSLVRFTLNRQS